MNGCSAKKAKARLRQTRIAVLGAGGLGGHVIAQAALLGVGGIATVDREDISLSNRNRYIGVWHTDPIPGSPKGALAKRHAHLIDPRLRSRRLKMTYCRRLRLNRSRGRLRLRVCGQ